MSGKIVIVVIFAIQLLLIGVRYIASRELTFTTNELLNASRSRNLVAKMKREKEADLAAAAIIIDMPIVNDPSWKDVSLHFSPVSVG